MGTLSGGGTEVISIGAGCLLGANAGIGISLGDHCVVEAGCYVTAGTKVTLQDGSVVKARELSGRDDLMFWRNSVSGAIEAVAREGHLGRAERVPARQRLTDASAKGTRGAADTARPARRHAHRDAPRHRRCVRDLRDHAHVGQFDELGRSRDAEPPCRIDVGHANPVLVLSSRR